MMWFGSWKTAEDGAGQVKYTQTRWAGVEPHMRGPHTTDLFEESRQAVNHNYFEKYPRLLKIEQHHERLTCSG